jgi:hypothetical protein
LAAAPVIMRKILKGPPSLLHYSLYSLCILLRTVQFSSSGSCFKCFQWVSSEYLLIKYLLKIYRKISQFQCVTTLHTYHPFPWSTVMHCSPWKTLWSYCFTEYAHSVAFSPKIKIVIVTWAWVLLTAIYCYHHLSCF